MKKLVIFLAIVMGIGLYNAEATIISKSFDLGEADVSSPIQVLNGLSAKAIFVLDTDNPTELRIELYNTSTDIPAGFDNSDQLLTAVSFDFGMLGDDGGAVITSGTVVIGAGGRSINFDNVSAQLTAGDDVSGEWGYANSGGTGLLTNFVSATRAHTIAFLGANLDGPDNISGPQAGISTDLPMVALGGLGAVADSVIISLTLNTSLSNLDFLDQNRVVAEFGSDAAFVVPEPVTLVLIGFGALLIRKKR